VLQVVVHPPVPPDEDKRITSAHLYTTGNVSSDKHVALALAKGEKRTAEAARLLAGREEREKKAKAVIEERTALGEALLTDIKTTGALPPKVAVSQLDGLLQVLGKYENSKGLLFGAKRDLVDDTLREQNIFRRQSARHS